MSVLNPVSPGRVTTRSVAGATTLPATPLGSEFQDTLTGDVTYSAPTGALAGFECSVDLLLIQDNTGGHAVTWPAITWVSGFAPVVPTGSGAKLLVNLVSLDGGATWFGSYGANGAIEAWRQVGAGGQPAFAAGWSNTGGTNAPAQFAKTASGLVLIEGGVTVTGIATTGFVLSAIFTLPAGYLPAGDLTWATSIYQGGTTVGIGQLKLIAASGILQLNYTSVTPSQLNITIPPYKAEQ